VFGDPVIKEIVHTVYFGAKQISSADLPIGLRWKTHDNSIGYDVFAYCGMLVSVLLYFVDDTSIILTHSGPPSRSADCF
jgi:hypothetical protein